MIQYASHQACADGYNSHPPIHQQTRPFQPILPCAHSLQMQLCPTNRSSEYYVSPPARPASQQKGVCVQRQEGWALKLCRHAATPGAWQNLTGVHADETNARMQRPKKKKKGRERQWPRERAHSPLEPHERQEKEPHPFPQFSLPPESYGSQALRPGNRALPN